MPYRRDIGTFAANEEPSLDELLADRSVRLLMASDRVDEGEVRRLASEASERQKAFRSEAGTAALQQADPRT